MGKYYIGFDCGTQSTKTAIYNEMFECIAEEAIPTEITYPKPDWVEMDADLYLESVKQGIRSCVKKSGIDPEKVRAICGDGIICGIVGVDRDGKAITPYIPYLDSRGNQDAQWINEHLEPIWIEESGNSFVEGFYPPILTRWLLKNHSEFQKNGVKVMNNGSYVLSRLAGLDAKDAFIDTATLSGWLVGYDAKEKKWSEEQMKLLDIPMDLLPKIVNPWDQIGTLSEEVAQETGLPSGIPIIAGAGDTMQSNLGGGLTESGMAADVAGTAAMLTIMVDDIHPELSRNSDLLFSIGTLPDTYFYWGYIRTGGLSLRWFRDNVCGREGDPMFYDEMQDAAEKVDPGANGVLFFPYLQGGNGPLKNASGCFLNMTASTGQGEMWRAILESIAFEYLLLIKSLEEQGIEVKQLIITEGGSKSSLWNQIKSDVLNVNVHTLKKREGAVMSNAVLAAYAVGDIADLKETISRLVEKKESYKPNQQNTVQYQYLFEKQQRLLKEIMEHTFAALKEI